MAYISDIDDSLPASGGDAGQGDDEIRQLKTDVSQSFPNVSGAVTATHTEINIIDGLLATTAELNYLQNLTENVQTHIDNSSFDIDADSGTANSIEDQDTLTIAGGEGIDTSVSGNTVTVAAELGIGANFGVVKLSSATDSTSGTADSIAATPQAIKTVFDLATGKADPATDSLAQNGYWWDENTGFIVQWGRSTDGTTPRTITFPTAFTTVYAAVACGYQVSNVPSVAVNSLTTTGFSGVFDTGDSNITVIWCAFGNKT